MIVGYEDGARRRDEDRLKERARHEGRTIKSERERQGKGDTE